MAKKTPKITAKRELLESFKELCSENHEIIMISLATSDGFNIKAFATKEVPAEADKISAMASTISSLSNASSKQILDKEFNVTTIESDNGNMLFVKTNYLDIKCVLSVATKSNMSLATARYITMRLSDTIINIED